MRKKQIQTGRAKEKKTNGYGSVIKLPGRRRKPWAIRVTDAIIDGKQIFRYVSYHETKTEALTALAMEQIYPTAPKSQITLSELFEEWKNTKAYKDLSVDTQNNYNAAYLHLSPLHNRIFKDIRTSHMEDLITNLSKNNKPMSHSSKSKVKILCGLLYKYAIQNDICSKNYAQFIRLDRQEKKEKEIFSDLEIELLFNNDSMPFVDSILILIFSGMRINEMLSLTKFNIDLKTGTITGGLKTDAGKNRIIPIHPKIRKYIEQRYDAASDKLFFKGNNEALSDNYYRKYIYYPILEELKIPKKNIHSTRHTTATLLAQGGADTNAIKQILGHSNYSFTADTYTHVDIEFLKNQISKF